MRTIRALANVALLALGPASCHGTEPADAGLSAAECEQARTIDNPMITCNSALDCVPPNGGLTISLDCIRTYVFGTDAGADSGPVAPGWCALPCSGSSCPPGMLCGEKSDVSTVDDSFCQLDYAVCAP